MPLVLKLVKGVTPKLLSHLRTHSVAYHKLIAVTISLLAISFVYGYIRREKLGSTGANDHVVVKRENYSSDGSSRLNKYINILARKHLGIIVVDP